MKDKYELEFYRSCFSKYGEDAEALGGLVSIAVNYFPVLRTSFLIDFFNKDNIFSILSGMVRDFHKALEEKWEYIDPLNLNILISTQGLYLSLTRRSLTTKLYDPISETEKEAGEVSMDSILCAASLNLILLLQLWNTMKKQDQSFTGPLDENIQVSTEDKANGN